MSLIDAQNDDNANWSINSGPPCLRQVYNDAVLYIYPLNEHEVDYVWFKNFSLPKCLGQWVNGPVREATKIRERDWQDILEEVTAEEKPRKKLRTSEEIVADSAKRTMFGKSDLARTIIDILISKDQLMPQDIVTIFNALDDVSVERYDDMNACFCETKSDKPLDRPSETELLMVCHLIFNCICAFVAFVRNTPYHTI